MIEFMHSKGKLNNGKELDYAFALSIGSYKGLKRVGHGGALGGYRSAMERFPDQKFSVIILSNLSSFNPTKIAMQIADIYLAEQIEKTKAEAEAKTGDKEKIVKLREEVKLPKKKLREKIGTYIHPETGEIIKLIYQDDKLKVILFNRNLPLVPVSEIEFHVLEAQVHTVLKFERQSEGKPLLMHIYQEGKEPLTYRAFKLPKPSPDQLREYEGDFYSEELQVPFRLRLKKDKLYFVHKNAPKNPLMLTLKDKFTVRNLKINFIRNEDKKIIAFTLNAGRVRNLRFDKK